MKTKNDYQQEFPTVAARFSREKKELIKEIAEMKGVSMSDVIRNMVNENLSQLTIDDLNFPEKKEPEFTDEDEENVFGIRLTPPKKGMQKPKSVEEIAQEKGVPRWKAWEIRESPE